MTLSRSLAVLMPLALLAACHKPAPNDQRSASGEVLQGTTSDAMLPLDSLKSQGPTLAPSEEKSTPEGQDDQDKKAPDLDAVASGASSDATSDDGTPDAAAPAPQASPKTAPSAAP